MKSPLEPLASKLFRIILTAALSPPWMACGDRAADPVALSRQAIALDPSWKEQVLNVPGIYARPSSVTVEGDAGTVSNPEGLRDEDSSSTTLTTTAAGSTRLIVDLGILVSGYVEIGVTRAAGAPIRMSYAEDRKLLGREGDASTDPDDFFYNGRTLGTDDDPDGRADVFAPPATAQVLTSRGLRGSQRYIAITLDGPGTATLDFIRVRQTHFAGAYDGHFLSSDADLNRAWYASAYAIDLSTIRDRRKTPNADWVIVDGPKRDRVAYAQDLWIVAISAYNQSAEYRKIVRDTIQLFACQQYPDGTFPAASVVDVPCELGNPGPPDGPPEGFEPPGEIALARLDSFTVWWVICLADYLKYTGDRSFVEPLLPVARRAMRFFADHAPDGTLWRADNYNQKLGFNWHPPDKATGIDAYSNAAYYGALRALATLERSLAGDTAAAEALEQRAERVRIALMEKLWDPQVGAMKLNTEDPRHDHTADANVGALLFGLLDEQQAQSAMAFLEQKLGTPYGTANSEFTDNPYMSQYISPYVMAQEALGRFQYGDGSGALRLIRKGWTHMLENGPGTPWEEIAINGGSIIPRPGTSLTEGAHVDLAHAWSTAVPALSLHVLGARPVSDGYAEWIVAPEPVDLRWAQGEVPVPAGKISVRWKRGDGDSSFVLTVEAPEATSGRVLVPLLKGERTIAMDGRIVWQKGRPVAGVSAHREGDAVAFTGLSGSHTFAWAR